MEGGGCWGVEVEEGEEEEVERWRVGSAEK